MYTTDHKTVIVDEIFEMLEAAKSSIVPGSVCQAIVAGVQNVPSSLIQHSVGGSSGACYTTFPLSPIVKNCCIDKTYLNLEFDINFHVAITEDAAASTLANKSFKVPMYIGFRDSFSLFNQIQFLIENSCLWQTVYQREESVNAYNSLPETEIRGNPQYSSIDKMKNGSKSPMKRIVLDFPAGTTQKDVTIHFKITTDINRLTPLFSNLAFTTPHMGNLRLKVFIQEIEKAMFFCPDYNWNGYKQFYFAGANPTTAETTAAVNALITSPQMTAFWSFYPLNGYWGTAIPAAQIPFYAFIHDTTANHNPYYIAPVGSVTFSNPTTATLDFMTFKDGIAEIVQTCFDIFDDDYKRLTDHFMSMGSVIIPTQTWSTGIFNNANITQPAAVGTAASWPQTMIGNIGGYSIDLIGVWAHGEKTPCSFSKEFLTGIQLLLEGRPINAVPYKYEDDKFLTDSTQAIIDTDHEEINKDYIDSVMFLNVSDDIGYLPAPPKTLYGTGLPTDAGTWGTIPQYQMLRGSLSNPNTFAMYFSTNLPNCFRSGACNLETTNRQAVLRLISTAAQNENLVNADRDKFPHFLNTQTNPGGTSIGFSCLCDCVIVLNMDERGTCYDGALSWAAPYQ